MLTWPETTARFAIEPFWWLATADPADGPHSVPVWGVVVDDTLYCYAAADSVRVRQLAIDPRAVVHTGSGVNVLIVHGRFADHGAIDADPAVVAAYRQKYADPDSRPWLPDSPDMRGGRMLRFTPTRAMAWRLDDFLGSQRRWES